MLLMDDGQTWKWVRETNACSYRKGRKYGRLILEEHYVECVLLQVKQKEFHADETTEYGYKQYLFKSTFG